MDELTAARLAASEHGSGTFIELAAIIDSELNRAVRKGKSLLESLTHRGTFGRQNKHRPASTRRDPRMRHPSPQCPTGRLEIVRRLDGELADAKRLPLPDLLKQHRHTQIAEQHPGLKAGLVFPTAKGTLHKGTPLRSVLDKACKELELPRITTHGLRRTFNNIARRVADGLVVRAIMGHSDEAMTEHYSVVDLEEARAAAAAVTARMGKGSGLVEAAGGNQAAATAPISRNPEGFRGGATRI